MKTIWALCMAMIAGVHVASADNGHVYPLDEYDDQSMMAYLSNVVSMIFSTQSDTHAETGREHDFALGENGVEESDLVGYYRGADGILRFNPLGDEGVEEHIGYYRDADGELHGSAGGAVGYYRGVEGKLRGSALGEDGAEESDLVGYYRGADGILRFNPHGNEGVEEPVGYYRSADGELHGSALGEDGAEESDLVGYYRGADGILRFNPHGAEGVEEPVGYYRSADGELHGSAGGAVGYYRGADGKLRGSSVSDGTLVIGNEESEHLAYTGHALNFESEGVVSGDIDNE